MKMKSTVLKSAAVAMMFAPCLASSAGESPLMIGWGRRSLNPGRPVAITGQHYLRVSLGEYNPVTANALVLENGRDAAIFVSLDMVSLRGGLLDMVRAKVAAAKLGIPAEKIIMNATHTHAGPSFSEKKPAVAGMEYMPTKEILDFISTQIADAVVEAWKTRKPGSVAYGYGFATTGHSRRVVYLPGGEVKTALPGADANGLARMYGDTSEKGFSHYEAGTDAFINLLYTFDAAGKLTGAVVNVPCPAQTNEHAWELHAGFWHHVRAKLRAKYGDIGVIGQAAAAGDLSPRQLHYNAAELRRYKLKFPKEYQAYLAKPLRYPEGFFVDDEERIRREERDLLDMMRAEDIALRIVAAFDEVLEWASREKSANPVLRHQVRQVELERRLISEEEYRESKRNVELLTAEKAQLEAAKQEVPRTLNARLGRSKQAVARHELQQKSPRLATEIHAVRIGDAAFTSNRFELYMDFMHRIQARSPFVQTFVVQLTAVPGAEGGSYLATERAAKNLGYSATLFTNQVSAKGGQELVEDTLEMLDELHRDQAE